jgi:hypothetical protein
MESKIYSTIVISSILTFALIAGVIPAAFVNVLAQEGAITPEGSVNDTMSGQNASQWATNATLAFAQGDDTGMSIDNSTMMNATLAYAQQGEGNTTITTGSGNGGGNATQGQTGGNMTGLTQGQAGGDNGDDAEENDEDNDEEEDDKDKE